MILLELKNNKAIIKNKETIYLENETLHFKIITELDGELFYTEDNKLKPIKNNEFSLDSPKEIKITHKSNGLPEIYTLDLEVKELKIIGETLDRKYPETIKDLFNKIKELEQVTVLLGERIEELEKDGVIE